MIGQHQPIKAGPVCIKCRSREYPLRTEGDGSKLLQVDDSRVVPEKAPSRWLRDSSEGAATSWWLRADGSSRGIALKRTARRRLRGDGSDVTAQGEWHRADVPLIIRRSLRSHNVYVCVRMGRCTNTWCSSTMTAPAVVDSVTASAGWCVGVLLGWC